MGAEKMKSKTLAVMLAVITLTIPSLTQGGVTGTIDICYSSNGAGGTANLWGGGLNGQAAKVGVYKLNKSNGTGEGQLWANGQIATFCLELSEIVPAQTKTYDIVLPEEAHKPDTFLGQKIGFEKAEYIRELWGSFFEPAWTGSWPFPAEHNNDAEAFAAALWEIIYEDLPASPAMWNITADGTSGPLGFYATNLDTSTANNMLHSLNGTGPKANLRAFVYDGKQDYIIQLPEPATVWLLAVGTLTLLRKRTRAT
jgi:hypothetical protein